MIKRNATEAMPGHTRTMVGRIVGVLREQAEGAFPIRYTGAHGKLPTYIAWVRARVRRTFTNFGAGVVPLGAFTRERILLWQPAKPLLARDGCMSGRTCAAKRGWIERRRTALDT